MTTQPLNAWLLCTLLSAATMPTAASATTASFFCGSDLGAPATMVRTPDGDKPFIRWTSNRFEAGGWSPERRCQEVSQRLQDASNRGNLRFLTTGRMNGQPVVCTASKEGGPCLDLLYTLKPEQDPAATLRGLLGARRGVSGPVSETTSRIYLNVDNLLSR